VEQGVEAVQRLALRLIQPHALSGKAADKEVGDSAEVSVGFVVGEIGSQVSVQGQQVEARL
jgi:hypothetical protein